MSINNHSSCFVTLTLKGVAGGGVVGVGGGGGGGGRFWGGVEDPGRQGGRLLSYSVAFGFFIHFQFNRSK